MNIQDMIEQLEAKIKEVRQQIRTMSDLGYLTTTYDDGILEGLQQALILAREVAL